MDGAVRLGGNIELFGCEKIEGAAMVVLKKMIGNYARQFSEKGSERLSVSFGDGKVDVEVVVNGNTLSASCVHANMFFSVDKALREIQGKL